VLGSKQTQLKLVLNVLCRISFMIYWVFDNLFILTKVKFLTSFEKTHMQLRSAQFWMMGILFSLAIVAVNFSDIFRDQAEVMRKFASASSDQERKDANDKRKQLDKKRKDNTLTAIKNCADLINATTGAKIPDMLGFKFPEVANACGGLVSSTITMYTLYPAPKK